MEEFKCGKIPPRYGKQMLNIYEDAKKVKDEWDKTQVRWGEMIDKLQAKLMEGGFLDEIIYDGMDIVPIPTNHSKFDNIVMKEKKTKKMTKAEAFEYFKRKKILAEGEDANISVQKKLFQCGIEWVNGGRVPFYYSDYLIVGDNGLLYHCGCDDRYWFAHFYESIGADDVLSIEVLEDKNNEFVDCSEPCP